MMRQAEIVASTVLDSGAELAVDAEVWDLATSVQCQLLVAHANTFAAFRGMRLSLLCPNALVLRFCLLGLRPPLAFQTPNSRTGANHCPAVLNGGQRLLPCSDQWLGVV